MRRFIPLVSALALALGPALALSPQAARAQLFVNVQVQFGPPPLPVYEQPPLPGPDYVWMPGYWAWDDDYGDYFWVPATWILAPRPGLLWTPAWWGWDGGLYVFHSGYWGPHVGFYGGVNYGFGYNGAGYEGGYWNGGHFFYNTTVNRVTNVNITNIYQKTVIVNNDTRVSFNGGPGGVQARPTPAQAAVANEPHIQPTAMQTQHVRAAQGDRALFATANHGAPPVAAAAQPGRLAGPGVVRAQAAGGPLPRALQNGPVGHGPQAQQAAVRAAGGAPPPRPQTSPQGQRPLGYNPGGPMQRAPEGNPGEQTPRPGNFNKGYPNQGYPRGGVPGEGAQGRPESAPLPRMAQPAPHGPQPGGEVRTPPQPHPAAPAYRPPPPRAAPPKPAPRPPEERKPQERRPD